MKRYLLFAVLILSVLYARGQAYIPIPTDSATWRYRIYDADYLVQVTDFILYMNGADTAANGNSYHKIFSRQCRQVGTTGFNPPVVTDTATSPDTYFGAIRESGKQVFELQGTGEQLIYDFTVSAGDSIPAYETKVRVAAIDSVLMSDGLFHKRYLTTDSTYFVIEGAGSNRGLIPDLNDGSGSTTFICLTYNPLVYSPDTTLPCTYIYPLGYTSSIAGVNDPAAVINIFPVPAEGFLHITTTMAAPLHATVYNDIGQTVWEGLITGQSDIRTGQWPRGVYYLQLYSNTINFPPKKIVLQ